MIASAPCLNTLGIYPNSLSYIFHRIQKYRTFVCLVVVICLLLKAKFYLCLQLSVPFVLSFVLPAHTDTPPALLFYIAAPTLFLLYNVTSLFFSYTFFSSIVCLLLHSPPANVSTWDHRENYISGSRPVPRSGYCSVNIA